MNRVIAPSMLAANFADLTEEIGKIERAGFSTLHLDVMDGDFVSPITFGHQMIQSLRPLTSMHFDVHLMVRRVEQHLPSFIEAGAQSLSFHLEAVDHADRLIHKIKDAGCRAGIALVPSSPVFLLKDLLAELDFVLIMSVNPGYGGQQFIPYTLGKICELNDLRRQHNHSFRIDVDGGINATNAPELFAAGANQLVVGSALLNNNFTDNAPIYKRLESEND